MHYDEFSNEYDAMFAQMARRSRNDRFVPNADVFLSPDERRIVVVLELAGVDAESLRVAVEERALWVAGRRSISGVELGACMLKEIEYGEFERKVHLPLGIERDRATASYHDGILLIELPVAADDPFPVTRTEIRLVIKRRSV